MAALSMLHPGNVGSKLGGSMVQSSLPSSMSYRFGGYGLASLGIGLGVLYLVASFVGLV